MEFHFFPPPTSWRGEESKGLRTRNAESNKGKGKGSGIKAGREEEGKKGRKRVEKGREGKKKKKKKRETERKCRKGKKDIIREGMGREGGN